jgi:preprotein translocase subunit SecE
VNTDTDSDIQPDIQSSTPQAAQPQQQSSEPPLASDEPGGFVPATIAELRKVVWPSRSQLFSESVAVILMVGLSAAVIAAVDRFYGWMAVQVFR